MKAISVKQPWAYLICAGIKDVENRTWKCPQKYIGERVLIQASAKAWTWHSVLNYLTDKTARIFEQMGFNGKWLRNLQTSAIIGSVVIKDCVINHPSVWAEKTTIWPPKSGIPKETIYNWVLSDPILFDKPILGVKGKLSFWDYDLKGE